MIFCNSISARNNIYILKIEYHITKIYAYSIISNTTTLYPISMKC